MKTTIFSKIPKTPAAIVLALALSSAATLPAAADECSDMITKVTEAISTAQLSNSDATQVENYRLSALQKQATGDTEGCVADLQQASALLGIE